MTLYFPDPELRVSAPRAETLFLLTKGGRPHRRHYCCALSDGAVRSCFGYRRAARQSDVPEQCTLMVAEPFCGRASAGLSRPHGTTRRNVPGANSVNGSRRDARRLKQAHPVTGKSISRASRLDAAPVQKSAWPQKSGFLYRRSSWLLLERTLPGTEFACKEPAKTLQALRVQYRPLFPVPL